METNTTSSGSAKGMQEKIMKQIRELGDSLERAGEKVERGGWEKIGQAISKLGNSLEHFKEKSIGSAVAAKTGNSKVYSDAEFDLKSKKPADLKASTDKIGGDESQAY